MQFHYGAPTAVLRSHSMLALLLASAAFHAPIGGVQHLSVMRTGSPAVMQFGIPGVSGQYGSNGRSTFASNHVHWHAVALEPALKRKDAVDQIFQVNDLSARAGVPRRRAPRHNIKGPSLDARRRGTPHLRRRAMSQRTSSDAPSTAARPRSTRPATTRCSRTEAAWETRRYLLI